LRSISACELVGIGSHESTSNNTTRKDVDSEDAESLAMTRRREEIAKLMWDQYRQVLNARIHDKLDS
jgi:hypothetical protein